MARVANPRRADRRKSVIQAGTNPARPALKGGKMKNILRDSDGNVVVPEGMIYVEKRPRMIPTGVPHVRVEIMVCDYYRKKKNKKQPKQSFFNKILSIFRR